LIFIHGVARKQRLNPTKKEIRTKEIRQKDEIGNADENRDHSHNNEGNINEDREEEEHNPEHQQQDQNEVDDDLDEDGFLRARARATTRDIF
jgi:hypothetical protein